jgi:hypothetical protein
MANCLAEGLSQSNNSGLALLKRLCVWSSFQNDFFDGLDICSVFLFEDAGGERFDGVVIADFNGALEDDRTGVESFVNEMDSAAGDLYAVFEGLFLRVEAGEGG